MTLSKQVVSPGMYRAELGVERPGAGGELLFTRKEFRFTDGVNVAVHREADQKWFGMFAPGAGHASGLLVGTIPSQLLVVSRGALYAVNALDPENYDVYDDWVDGALSSDDGSILVYWNPWKIAAFNEHGPLWEGPFIADGFRDVAIDGSDVVGVAYVPGRGDVSFRLDVTTGVPYA